MADLFKTKKAALSFLNERMKNCTQVETEILFTLSDHIISQEHSSYFDFDLNGKYNASILETKDGFKVDIAFKKHSAIVLAAEAGDLELFKKEFQKNQSTNALSLAFVMAILCENLNILQFYYSADYVKRLSLFIDPLITASRNDNINSFQFFLRRGLKLPNEILGPIFHDNSKFIMSHIIGDTFLSKAILEEKYQTAWAKNELLKKDNEATRMFKAHLNDTNRSIIQST